MLLLSNTKTVGMKEKYMNYESKALQNQPNCSYNLCSLFDTRNNSKT